ncbi:MAG: hypothetical protein M0Q94_04330 [Candidatus Cloacimonetes bacterium]|nr:hypothetical protein [Candidatus Cloacimonadota bacterium]
MPIIKQKKITKPSKDGTHISLKLKADLFKQLKLSAEALKSTQTDIIEAALTSYFENNDSFTFVDDVNEKMIEDKDSMMIPKDLYARLNGLSITDLEIFIKKNKIKVVSLASDKTDKEKRISYLSFNLSDQKSMMSLLINLQHSVEILKLNLLKANQKINGIEANIEKILN